MYIVNFIDSLSDSDSIFYILMILLALISLILFYLIYTQNKEMVKKEKEKSLFPGESVSESSETAVSINEVESLEKPSLIEVSNLEIPDPLELTKSLDLPADMDDLQSLTKELENLPKERKIQMTPYEEEQEETAIISYDELVQQSDRNDKVDFMIEDIPMLKKEEVVDMSYAHEEDFLNSLKDLQTDINEIE